MSDSHSSQQGWGQQSPQQPSQQGWGQQSPQQPQQPQQPTGVVTQSNVRKSPLGRIGLGVALFALLGIGSFAVFTAVSGPSTGTATPEEGVDEFFTALDNEDFLTMGKNLAPAERESLIEPSVRSLKELERLKIVEQGTDIDNVSGLEISVAGLGEPKVETVNENLRWVTIDQGSITSSVDPSQLPVGDLFSDELKEEEAESETTNLAEEPFSFAMVQEDGSWYVSLYYSIAEDLRRNEGSAAPNPNAAPTPLGADSPEAAVEQTIQKALDVDAQGVLTMMDPDEFKAAYEYSSLYIPDIQEELSESKKESNQKGTTWQMDSFESEVEKRDGETVVVPTSWKFSGNENGSEPWSIESDGECTSLTFGGEVEKQCKGDLGELEGEPYAETLKAVQNADYGLRVVERDGQWYVSGMPTLIGLMNDMFKELDEQDASDLLDPDKEGSLLNWLNGSGETTTY